MASQQPCTAKSNTGKPTLHECLGFHEVPRGRAAHQLDLCLNFFLGLGHIPGHEHAISAGDLSEQIGWGDGRGATSSS
eukprot:2530623-Rhodomonas_salina.1